MVIFYRSFILILIGFINKLCDLNIIFLMLPHNSIILINSTTNTLDNDEHSREPLFVNIFGYNKPVFKG